jgi:hypothetical protein
MFNTRITQILTSLISKWKRVALQICLVASVTLHEKHFFDYKIEI